MPQASFYWVEYNSTTPGTQTPSWDSGQNPARPSGSLSNADFLGDSDSSSNGNATNYQSHPIQVPGSGTTYSYEKWIRAYFLFYSGVTNIISNCHFYLNNSPTVTLNDKYLAIFGKSQLAYAQPGNTNRSGGAGTTVKLISSDGGGTPVWTRISSPNTGSTFNSGSGTETLLGYSTQENAYTRIGLNNGSAGGQSQITASNWSDFIVLQLAVPSTVTTPGNIASSGVPWIFQYDEQ